MLLSIKRSWVMVTLLAIPSSFVAACSSSPDSTTVPPADSGSNCSKPGALVNDECRDGSVPVDSGVDSTVPDTSGTDSGVDSTVDTADTFVVDSGSPETAPDTSPADSGVDSTVDSTVPDTTPVETGFDGGTETAIPDGFVLDTADSATTDSGSDTGSDTGTPDTGVTDSGTDTAPTTFGCTGWTRDLKFELLGPDVVKAKAIKVFASDKLYASVATLSKGFVAFGNGAGWVRQSLSPEPQVVLGMDGVTEDDLCVVGWDAVKGRVYCQKGGIWSEDTTAPSTDGFVDIYAASPSVKFLLGADSQWHVWLKTSSTWSMMALPTLSLTGATGLRLSKIWGISASNVFVTGYYDSTSAGGPIKAIVIHYDGTSWTELGTPSDAREIYGVHGSSTDALYFAGANLGGQGTIYQLSSSLSTWSSLATSSGLTGYGAIWSPKPGAVLAESYASSGGAGSARITTMAPLVTTPVDGNAFNIASFASEPGTDKVHFVHVASSGVAGHYVGICK